MAIESTSSVTSAAVNQLRLDDLLQLLLTELTNPDPLNPPESKDFMAQMAQFASLDTQQQLNQNILQLLSLQALNQSVGLVNRRVSAVTQTGEIIDGRVIAVTLENGAPRLTIEEGGGSGRTFPNIPIGALQTIRP